MMLALEGVNEVHVKYSWFAPALMEKARFALMLFEWPDVLESVAKLQQMDGNNAMVFAYRSAALPPLPLVRISLMVVYLCCHCSSEFQGTHMVDH
jgi:hypothetical protein